MDIKNYEDKLSLELNEIINVIIQENPTLPIAVKKGGRVGDAISKFLEKEFVAKTKKHTYFSNSEASPETKTKNPWDAKTDYIINDFKQEIWIDFKAINVENKDSNPDAGTPDKIIDLIFNGNFYLVYVYVFYKGEEEELKFKKKDNTLVKLYLLKDINATFRITPANQIQVNYLKNPEYRTREAFLNLLLEKKIESNQRKLDNAEQKLQNLKNKIFKKTKTKEIKFADLISKNAEQENIIKTLKAL